MDSSQAPNKHKELNLSNPAVLCGHKVCNSQEVKWLGITNMYQKFHRPNYFDIGGTYLNDLPDFWLTSKTERVGEIFLLHIFATRHDDSSFVISLSETNHLTVDTKYNIIHMSDLLKKYNIEKSESEKHNRFVYVTTYNFSELDILLFKDRDFYIHISLLQDAPNQTSIALPNYDWSDLLTDPIASDFTIESSDNIKFKVHKALLSTYSDVFRAMFKEETAESQNSYVKLVDVESVDLKCMLEFIYTGTIKDMKNANFEKLLSLADLYNIKDLWKLSEYALVQQLCTLNVLDILAFAHLYGSDFVKTSAFKFIKKNPDVLNMKSFKELADVQLLRQLCLYLAVND